MTLPPLILASDERAARSIVEVQSANSMQFARAQGARYDALVMI